MSITLALTLMMSATSIYADEAQFHPRTMTVDGQEGIWLPKDEMARLLEAAAKKKELETLSERQDKALSLSQITVATSSAAVQQYKFASNQATALLQECRSALQSETDRCESIWRQPVIPLGIGIISGAVMCIGTSRAQR